MAELPKKGAGAGLAAKGQMARIGGGVAAGIAKAVGGQRHKAGVPFTDDGGCHRLRTRVMLRQTACHPAGPRQTVIRKEGKIPRAAGRHADVPRGPDILRLVGGDQASMAGGFIRQGGIGGAVIPGNVAVDRGADARQQVGDKMCVVAEGKAASIKGWPGRACGKAGAAA